MKRITIALVLLCATLTTYAQRKGLWLLPGVSVGKGTMLDFDNLIHGNNITVFTAGCEAQHMFSERFGLGAGLAYGRYAGRLEWLDDYTGPGYHDFTQHTLDIPLYCRWVWGTRNGFFTNLGAVNNILLKGTLDGQSNKYQFVGYTFSPFVYFGGNFTIKGMQCAVGPQVQYQGTVNFKSLPVGQYLTFALKASVGFQLKRSVAKAAGVQPEDEKMM